MKTKIELKIPKNKIGGERFGQLIYNAIRKSYRIPTIDRDIADRLFNIENEELQRVIDNYVNDNLHV